MNQMPQARSYVSSQKELSDLLSEYTGQLKKYIDLNVESELRSRNYRRNLVAIVGTIAVSAMFAALSLEFFSDRIVSVDSVGAVFAAALMVFLFSIILTDPRFLRLRSGSTISHEVELTAKILERVVERAVQFADHNKREIDFTFDIRIAEAQAILSQFEKRY